MQFFGFDNEGEYSSLQTSQFVLSDVGPSLHEAHSYGHFLIILSDDI